MVGGTSTITDEGSCTVAVVTAKIVGQLMTGILVALASWTVVEVVDVGAVVDVDDGAEPGRTVGPVVVGGCRSACGELSAHPAAKAATHTRLATRSRPNPLFPMP
jgi:hypothetical protein